MSRNLTFALAVAGGLALATAGHAAGAPDTPSTWLGLPRWVFAWLNLIVLWGLLYRAAGPMVRNYLNTRRKEIQDGLALAKNQRAQTEEMSADLDRQLAGLKDDLQQMVERNKAEGERERQEILAQADQDKERLLEQADFEIRSRTAQAKATLTRVTARQAADAATVQVASELSAADRDRLFDVSLGRLREKLS